MWLLNQSVPSLSRCYSSGELQSREQRGEEGGGEEGTELQVWTIDYSIQLLTWIIKDLYQVLLGIYLSQRWIVEFKEIT